MEKEMVIVLDYGGQYNQLIARRVRECNVYCEVKPYNSPIEEIKKLSPKGIIITGGPNSVYAEDALLCDKELFTMGVPILVMDPSLWHICVEGRSQPRRFPNMVIPKLPLMPLTVSFLQRFLPVQAVG